MKQIPLTQGQFALVDDEDYDELMKHRWHAVKTKYGFYAARNEGGRQFRVHWAIMGKPDGMDIDHANGNGLDNQRHNLRVCTASQNVINSGPRKDNTSGCKGVNWDKGFNRWRVRLGVNNRRIHLGRFFCYKKAVEAYNKAVVKHYGDFARVCELPPSDEIE